MDSVEGRGCGLVLVGALFLVGSLAFEYESFRLATSGERVSVEVVRIENVLVSKTRHREKRGREVTMRGVVDGKRKLFRDLKPLDWEEPSEPLEVIHLPDEPLVLATSDESLLAKPLLCLLIGLVGVVAGLFRVLK